MAHPVDRLGAAALPEAERRRSPLTAAVRRTLAAAGVLAAGAYLWTEGPGPDALGPWLKPWPAALLAVWVLAEGRGALGRLVAGGLALSAVADVVIEHAFAAGLALFLAAHVVYAVAFVADERRPRLARAVPFVAYGILMYAYLRPRLGDLALPVGVYVVAIVTMMWRAAARVRPGDRAAFFGLLGALLFGASDSLLAVHRFDAPVPGAAYAVMVLYWAGQLGIAGSAVRPD